MFSVGASQRSLARRRAQRNDRVLDDPNGDPPTHLTARHSGIGLFESAPKFAGRILFPVSLEYQPQLILISAGFDIHYDDPIGGMKVTENGFAYLTSVILEIADRICNGKVVAILEGGYDLGALRRSVKSVLETLCGEFKEEVKSHIDTTDPDPSTLEIIQEVKNNYKEFWRSLNNA